MVDIPELLKLKREKELEQQLKLLSLMVASNNRSISDREYEKVVKNLTPTKEIDRNKFDRQAIERLRMMSGGRG